MQNEDLMNILFSFILIGIIVLINSISNTLWGLYWIMFSLYMIMFVMMGIKEMNSSISKLLMNVGPVILISVLITWLIQIFKTHQDKILTDTYNRRVGMEPLFPDTFYSLYSAALFLLIVQILILLKNTRENIIPRAIGTEAEGTSKTLMRLSVYGIGIIVFMLIFAMYITATYYVTDG